MGARIHVVGKAIRAAVHPEEGFDDEGRRAFEREAQEGNARIFRWVACVLAPLHGLAVVLFLTRREVEPARVAWLFWMVCNHATQAAFGIAAAVVAWSGRPARLWNVLGDVAGGLYLLSGAAMSANAQRAHPNVNVFVLCAAATAVVRMRPRVYVGALLAGNAVVLSGIAYFPRDTATRLADVVTLLTASSLSLVFFFINRAMRARELGARLEARRLNAELERRVEAQVGEIKRRAREIDELNIQLNERIRGRSRELSRALARLAEGQEALPPGTVLGGRVEIEAWIGQGGMGAVYRGRDRVTGRTVAVKVVQASSASELDGLYRFLREAQAMASVTHRAIVRPIHVDVSEDGRLFHVMELVVGKTLEACLTRSGTLSPRASARLGAVLADALAAAHAAGIVHRDVKPANVMLTMDPPGLKLLDFGISKLWDATGKQTEGGILGTPEFLSPEQLNAPETVAAPADVYALGLLLYLCLSGRLPFDADAQLFARIFRRPLDVAKWVPDLDPALARTVMACLHKDPTERPRAADVAAKLAEIADADAVPPLEALDLVGPEAPATAAAATPGPPTAEVTPTSMPIRETEHTTR